MKPPTPRPLIPTLPLRRRHPQRQRRPYAVQTPGPPSLQVFNQRTKFLQKERAAHDAKASRKVEYLRDEVARRVCDRLLDINRHFPDVLDLGANSLNIARHLTSAPPSSPLATKISHLTCADTSPTLLHRDPLPSSPLKTTFTALPSPETLPYAPSSFSAILSSMSLHWTNDLPSLLRSAHTCLQPDSPLLLALPGAETLHELRSSLHLCSLERLGGVGLHVSPFADVRDIGGLLTRAGFQMLTVDTEEVVIGYPSVYALMADLGAMGEGNAVLAAQHQGGLSRDVLLGLEGVYREMYGVDGAEIEGGVEGGSKVLPATFRIVHAIGWKEGPGQRRPLKRGSAERSMKDVLEGRGERGE
ncbi:MAG: hypothetical protein M1824_004155 [Vezdaea acicularis]|nr:MAG: hypothetical protein M1824_004155 [Vezdaea acicularis]